MGIGIDTAFIILKNKIPNALNSTVTEKHILLLRGQALEKLAEYFSIKLSPFPFGTTAPVLQPPLSCICREIRR